MSVKKKPQKIDLEGPLDPQACAWQLRGMLTTLKRHVSVSFFHVIIVYRNLNVIIVISYKKMVKIHNNLASG